MTISSSTRKAGPFTGTGVVTTFPFTFKVFQASDLLVVRLNSSTSIESTLVLNTDYTVSLNQNQNTNPGGSVVLGSALASGYTLTITSDIGNLQPTDLTNQGGFYPSVINDALDRATIQVQQLAERADRSLTLALSTPSGVSATLPAPEANQLICWNGTATGLSNVSSSEVASIVAYGTANTDLFTGTGSATAFVLSANPGSLNNLRVSINGLAMTPGVDFTWSTGTTLTFTTAPALNDDIVVQYMQALSMGTGDAANIQYTPAVTGGVARTQSNKNLEGISVKDFGAKGDGVTNDTAAFALASAYITAQGGGKLIIPHGTYIVGQQTFAGATGKGYAYQAATIMSITNCAKPVVIEFQGAILKMAPGLKFGSFNPVTGASYTPVLPFTNPDYAADVGTMLFLQNNKSVEITGSCEMDGNLQNAVLGGQWGDVGYQRDGRGINAYNNENLSIENLYAHHHCLDGLSIGYTGLVESDTAKPVTLHNVVSEYNARQGFSWVGGNQLTAISCKFNHTGKSTFVSAPGAGIDIEAESAVIRNGTFIDCEFANNSGLGIGADSGDSAGVTFIRCKAIGTTSWSSWTRKPRFSFYDCLFVGAVVNPYSSTTNPDDATKYFNCKFTDEVAYSPTGVVYLANYVVNFDNFPNVTLDGCTIVATQSKAGMFRGGSILRNCTVIVKVGTDKLANQNDILHMQSATFENLTILEQITSNIPVDGYFVYLPSAVYSGTNYISSASSKVRWWSWSGGAGGAAGYLGQNYPEQAPFTAIALGKTQGGGLIGYYGQMKIVAWNAAPTTGTWAVGDQCINSNPVVGQPKGWRCTSASDSTTGSITSGTTALTVASGTGINNGDTIAIVGAGAAGATLTTTVSAGGGTTALTLAAAASTTVSGAAVTTPGTWVSEGNL